jgi:hypothetical protein
MKNLEGAKAAALRINLNVDGAPSTSEKMQMHKQFQRTGWDEPNRTLYGHV